MIKSIFYKILEDPENRAKLDSLKNWEDENREFEVYQLFKENGYGKDFESFKIELRAFLNSNEIVKIFESDGNELPEEALESVAGGFEVKHAVITGLTSLVLACTGAFALNPVVSNLGKANDVSVSSEVKDDNGGSGSEFGEWDRNDDEKQRDSKKGPKGERAKDLNRTDREKSDRKNKKSKHGDFRGKAKGRIFRETQKKRGPRGGGSTGVHKLNDSTMQDRLMASNVFGSFKNTGETAKSRANLKSTYYKRNANDNKRDLQNVNSGTSAVTTDPIASPPPPPPPPPPPVVAKGANKSNTGGSLMSMQDQLAAIMKGGLKQLTLNNNNNKGPESAEDKHRNELWNAITNRRLKPVPEKVERLETARDKMGREIAEAFQKRQEKFNKNNEQNVNNEAEVAINNQEIKKDDVAANAEAKPKLTLSQIAENFDGNGRSYLNLSADDILLDGKNFDGLSLDSEKLSDLNSSAISKGGESGYYGSGENSASSNSISNQSLDLLNKSGEKNIIEIQLHNDKAENSEDGRLEKNEDEDRKEILDVVTNHKLKSVQNKENKDGRLEKNEDEDRKEILITKNKLKPLPKKENKDGRLEKNEDEDRKEILITKNKLKPVQNKENKDGRLEENEDEVRKEIVEAAQKRAARFNKKNAQNVGNEAKVAIDNQEVKKDDVAANAEDKPKLTLNQIKENFDDSGRSDLNLSDDDIFEGDLNFEGSSLDSKESFVGNRSMPNMPDKVHDDNLFDLNLSAIDESENFDGNGDALNLTFAGLGDEKGNNEQDVDNEDKGDNLSNFNSSAISKADEFGYDYDDEDSSFLNSISNQSLDLLNKSGEKNIIEIQNHNSEPENSEDEKGESMDFSFRKAGENSKDGKGKSMEDSLNDEEGSKNEKEKVIEIKLDEKLGDSENDD